MKQSIIILILFIISIIAISYFYKKENLENNNTSQQDETIQQDVTDIYNNMCPYLQTWYEVDETDKNRSNIKHSKISYGSKLQYANNPEIDGFHKNLYGYLNDDIKNKQQKIKNNPIQNVKHTHECNAFCLSNPHCNLWDYNINNKECTLYKDGELDTLFPYVNTRDIQGNTMTYKSSIDGNVASTKDQGLKKYNKPLGIKGDLNKAKKGTDVDNLLSVWAGENSSNCKKACENPAQITNSAIEGIKTKYGSHNIGCGQGKIKCNSSYTNYTPSGTGGTTPAPSQKACYCSIDKSSFKQDAKYNYNSGQRFSNNSLGDDAGSVIPTSYKDLEITIPNQPLQTDRLLFEFKEFPTGLGFNDYLFPSSINSGGYTFQLTHTEIPDGVKILAVRKNCNQSVGVKTERHLFIKNVKTGQYLNYINDSTVQFTPQKNKTPSGTQNDTDNGSGSWELVKPKGRRPYKNSSIKEHTHSYWDEANDLQYGDIISIALIWGQTDTSENNKDHKYKYLGLDSSLQCKLPEFERGNLKTVNSELDFDQDMFDSSFGKLNLNNFNCSGKNEYGIQRFTVKKKDNGKFNLEYNCATIPNNSVIEQKSNPQTINGTEKALSRANKSWDKFYKGTGGFNAVGTMDCQGTGGAVTSFNWNEKLFDKVYMTQQHGTDVYKLRRTDLRQKSKEQGWTTHKMWETVQKKNKKPIGYANPASLDSINDPKFFIRGAKHNMCKGEIAIRHYETQEIDNWNLKKGNRRDNRWSGNDALLCGWKDDQYNRNNSDTVVGNCACWNHLENSSHYVDTDYKVHYIQTNKQHSCQKVPLKTGVEKDAISLQNSTGMKDFANKEVACGEDEVITKIQFGQTPPDYWGNQTVDTDKYQIKVTCSKTSDAGRTWFQSKLPCFTILKGESYFEGKSSEKQRYLSEKGKLPNTSSKTFQNIFKKTRFQLLKPNTDKTKAPTEGSSTLISGKSFGEGLNYEISHFILKLADSSYGNNLYLCPSTDNNTIEFIKADTEQDFTRINNNPFAFSKKPRQASQVGKCDSGWPLQIKYDVASSRRPQGHRDKNINNWVDNWNPYPKVLSVRKDGQLTGQDIPGIIGRDANTNTAESVYDCHQQCKQNPRCKRFYYIRNPDYVKGNITSMNNLQKNTIEKVDTTGKRKEIDVTSLGQCYLSTQSKTNNTQSGAVGSMQTIISGTKYSFGPTDTTDGNCVAKRHEPGFRNDGSSRLKGDKGGVRGPWWFAMKDSTAGSLEGKEKFYFPTGQEYNVKGFPSEGLKTDNWQDCLQTCQNYQDTVGVYWKPNDDPQGVKANTCFCKTAGGHNAPLNATSGGNKCGDISIGTNNPKMAKFLSSTCTNNQASSLQNAEINLVPDPETAPSSSVDSLKLPNSWVHLYLCNRQDDRDSYPNRNKNSTKYGSTQQSGDIKFGPNEGRCKVNLGDLADDSNYGSRRQSERESGAPASTGSRGKNARDVLVRYRQPLVFTNLSNNSNSSS